MKKPNSTAILIAITALLATAGPAFAAGTAETPMTLGEAIRLTKERNPRALQAGEELKAADARVTESRSAWYPQVSVKSGYTYLDPVQMEAFMPHDNYSAKVAAEMVLFDFGRTGSRVDIAKTGRRAAGISRDLTLRDLSLATARSFYSVLFLQEAVKVQEKEIAALSGNLEHMQKRYREGAATRFDLLTTEVRLSAARDRRIALLSQLENQEIALRRLCGLKGSGRLPLSGSFKAESADADAGKLTAAALDHRPEVALSRENLHAAEARRALAVKEWFPTITGAASWGTSNGYYPDIKEMRTNVMAGVQLQVPLFNGFRTSAANSEAKASMHAAQQQRFDAEEQAQAEVKQALNSLRTSRERIGTTSLQVSQAELAAQQARIRHQNGMGTTLDLLDAEAALAQAELANLQARYEQVLNTYEVRRASGDLIEN